MPVRDKAKRAIETSPGALHTSYMSDTGDAAKVQRYDDLGALLGWSAQDYGPNLVLRLQNTRDVKDGKPDVVETRLMLNKEQAVLLGNMLFEMAGRIPPAPRKMPLTDRIVARISGTRR